MRTLALLVALVALPVQADLASQIRASKGWVGYVVPIAEGRHLVCSFDEGITINRGSDYDDFARSSALHVLYRVEDGEVTSVRLSSPECNSTRVVQWLPNPDPGESARFLVRLINDPRDRGVAKKAVGALALHRDTVNELINLAKKHESGSIRSAALFWVSQRAGDRAAGVLKDAIDNDPEEDVRAKAVFGISQLPDDKSIPLLIQLMKTHGSRAVRKKAAFWLGQKDDPRALAALEEVLTH
jgi:HEAT repeat protein